MNQNAHDKYKIEGISQSMTGTVRKTIEMDTELSQYIQDMADEKVWSFSYMSYVLLQQAVKEKNRKKKKVIEHGTENR